MLLRMLNKHSGRSIEEQITVDNANVVSSINEAEEESAQDVFSEDCIPHIKPEPLEDDAEETLPENISTDDPLALPSTVQCKQEIDVKVEQEVKIEVEENDVDTAHLTAGGAEVLHCKLCSYHCLGRDMLEKHVKTKHSNMGRELKYKCDMCSFSTNVSCHMKEHRMTHTGERPFRCDKCNKAFARQTGLRDHLRCVHAGLRPHSCDVCGKTFFKTGHLTVHKRIHTGTVVVQCEQCGKQFNNRCNYNAHMKSFHGVKAHKCQVCSAGFVHRSELTIHMRKHTGERPYACPHCEARFSRLCIMEQHAISVHTHDYKHRCERCGKGFVAPNLVRKHSIRCSL